jgi:outer membrane lipoprotein-sorting protein
MFSFLPRCLRQAAPLRLPTALLALAVSAVMLTGVQRPALALTNAEAAEAVGEVSKYINGFRTLQGEFTQIGPTGNVSKGVFIISKPGKMRFEYSDPNPYIIVSDGMWVTIKNRAKERGDQYPLSQTPLRLVLSDGVDLEEETRILNVEKAEDLTSITLEDRKAAVPGQLVLIYDNGRKALQSWVVIDGKGRRTTVSLDNVETGVEVDPKLFEIAIDRSKRRRGTNK